MSITADTVRLVAPEFESEDDSRIESFITFASEYINTTIWGDKADYAHSLFTAHLMTVSNRGGGAGIQSETVGDLSRSYAVTSGDALQSTSYGSLFAQLRKTLLYRPLVIR